MVVQSSQRHAGSLSREPADIDYKNELNSEQFAVVRDAEGPCLVLAGAGSGKTRTLVYRVAWLIAHGTPADRILLLTFTNKAAHAMLSRAAALAKGEVKGLWGGTFHHIANRILRVYAGKLGFKPQFQILDEDDAERLMRSVLVAEGPHTAGSVFPKADAVRRVLSFAANSGISIEHAIDDHYPQFIKFKDFFPAIARAYEEKKRAMNAMDFDDLLVNLLRLLEQFPLVREKLSSRFQYVLVDEYQDTNRLQAGITHLLASVHGNLLVVGDDAQSIYSFRAADIGNILEFTDRYPKAKVFRLETNYRSRPEILTLANESIRHNSARYKKELKTSRKSGIVPLLASAPDPEAQASYVVAQVLARAEAHMSLHDMAVLFRASHQTLELELELAKHDIPYLKRGGLRYFEQAHIKDVLGYVRILANPADELAWRRVLQLYEGIGAQTADRIWRLVKQSPDHYLTVADEMKNMQGLSSRVERGVEEVWEDLRAFVASAVKGPGEIIIAVLARRYREYAKNAFDDAEERILDLETLANFASRYEDLPALLADAALGEGFRGEVKAADAGQDEDKLILSTIHQAKGLEWKTVFVIGLVDGHFPNARTLEREKELEEERRLFYVAVTRAQEELILTYPETSYLSSGYLLGRPSLFVRELPKKVYQRWMIEDGGSDDAGAIDIDKEEDEVGGILGKVIRTMRH